MREMKVCVFGVGAIGGLLGYGLAKAGCELSGVARGATLQALRDNGLRFLEGEGIASVPIRASAESAELGAQDLVVLAVKAPALAEASRRIAPLLGPRTIVLTAMNGVPWWFFHGRGRRARGHVPPLGRPSRSDRRRHPRLRGHRLRRPPRGLLPGARPR